MAGKPTFHIRQRKTKKDQDENWEFELKGGNGEHICGGHGFNSEVGARRSVKLVQDFAKSARVVVKK